MLEFENGGFHKARKPHKCFLCSREIGAGERYYRLAYKCVGEFYDESYHIACWDILNEYWMKEWIMDTWDPIMDTWDPADVRAWLEDTYCRECLGEDADLADCEVPVFRCRKIIEKLVGKEARDG